MIDEKKIRDYYEKIALGRFELVSKLSQKKIAGKETFWSAEYNMGFKEKLYNEVIKKISLKPKCVVLDCGCGYGEDLSFISKAADFSGYGLDFSLAQLKQASFRVTSKRIKFIQADINYLPFKNNSFDIVIFSEVIEHFNDSKNLLREIYRILKNDGYIFLTTPNRFDYFHFLGGLIPLSLRKKIKRAIITEFDIDTSEYAVDLSIKEHEHLFGFKEINEVLKKAGFLVENFMTGKLSVPFARMFDHSKKLQLFWQRFDDLLAKIPISKYFYRNFLFVLKKNP